MDEQSTETGTKQLVMISKIGPAFSVNEIQAAHKALDNAGIPREFEGNILTLTERIHWMHGMLNAFTLYCEAGGTA